MNDPSDQGTPAPLEQPQAPPATPPAQAAPAEEPWLLHYAGTEPLTKGAYTWQPDSVVEVPESIARTLFGADNLRVVQDRELFEAMRARQVAPTP